MGSLHQSWVFSVVVGVAGRGTSLQGGLLIVLVADLYELVLLYPGVGRPAKVRLNLRLVRHLLVELRTRLIEPEGVRGPRHRHGHLIQARRLQQFEMPVGRCQLRFQFELLGTMIQAHQRLKVLIVWRRVLLIRHGEVLFLVLIVL